ncbi:MAG: RNA-directed DNA polymerase [Saprospiraceae bacterium]|jgi:RNA-directed DNA polymerase
MRVSEDGESKCFAVMVEMYDAVKNLNNKGYKALAVRRIKIPKSNDKLRPLCIPTMHDRAMQALHLLGLDPVSETLADTTSYGFRPYRSCADAINKCHKLLAKKVSPTWILEGDIKGCFDNISHEWLLENIPMNKGILKQWLKSGYLEKQQLFSSNQGTPQGSVISPTLANMVLDGMVNAIDKALNIRRNRNDRASG